MSVYHCGQCRPDPVWSRQMAEKILRLSGVSSDDCQRIEINCGNGCMGAVVLKDGSRVVVGGRG